MSKILYPVGTQVTLRKFPNLAGLIVTQYKKGEKYPYRVGLHAGDEVIIEGKSKFSKAGLKRYNPTQTKAIGNTLEPQKCDCMTRAEVEKMIQSVITDVYHDLGLNINLVKEAVMKSAEISDHNFLVVNHQIKTLNHDDD